MSNYCNLKSQQVSDKQDLGLADARHGRLETCIFTGAADIFYIVSNGARHRARKAF